MTASAIYDGQVWHKRFAPKTHQLRYRLFQLLIDLDELPELDRALRWFSWNRRNLFSFRDADHGEGRGGLKLQVHRLLAEHGLSDAAARVLLLCMPRVLGFVFNPISIYYCHRADGSLGAMLYEVNNTFGQRHSYLVPVDADAGDLIRQSASKRLHVSPFMGMDMGYAFALTRPGARIMTRVDGLDAEGRMLITASFSGERRALSDLALLRLLVVHPLMTLKVVGAIHFEAVKLLLKGLRLQPQPPHPATPVSLSAPGRHRSVKQSA